MDSPIMQIGWVTWYYMYFKIKSYAGSCLSSTSYYRLNDSFSIYVHDWNTVDQDEPSDLSHIRLFLVYK